MPKKILIPIDFKVESLNTLKIALNEITEEVEVVLMYLKVHLLKWTLNFFMALMPRPLKILLKEIKLTAFISPKITNCNYPKMDLIPFH
jgi:hypothetical protein